MTGLRVLHVVPGDLGNDWSWAIDYAATAGTGSRLNSGRPVFNALWISPFFTRTAAQTFNRYERKGSLYAIRNHLEIDPSFSKWDQNDPERVQKDNKDLLRFCTAAREAGVRVLGDLVLNHVAIDHPMAVLERQRIEDIKNNHPDYSLRVVSDWRGTRDSAPYDVQDGEKIIGVSHSNGTGYLPLHFCYNKELRPVVDSSLGQEWSDVAKINYQCPESQGFFVDLWKQQIKWLLGVGFTGFRCDAAYKIPASIWTEIIQFSHDEYARLKDDDTDRQLFKHPVWVAENLGGSPGQAWESIGSAKIKRDGKELPAFDNMMLWTHWWDGEKQDYADHSHSFQEMVRFGGLGVPDNHDTEQTFSSLCMKDFSPDVVADQCLIKAVKSFVLGATGICMEYGYLRCLEEQASIFDESEIFDKRRSLMEERRPGHPLNIESQMWAVANYFDSLEQRSLIPQFDRARFLHYLGEGGNLRCYPLTLRSAGKEREEVGHSFVLINTKPESGAARISIQDIFNAKGLSRDQLACEPIILSPQPVGADGREDELLVDTVAILTTRHIPSDGERAHHVLPSRSAALV